jgi:hypothetical protein
MPCSPCHVGDNLLAPITLDMPGACGSPKMRQVFPPSADGDASEALMTGTVS